MTRSLLRRTPALWRQARKLRFDVIIVGFRAHSDMFLAGLLAKMRGVPLVFDPLTSRYEERVIDRKLTRVGSALARWYLLHRQDRVPPGRSDPARDRRADRLLRPDFRVRAIEVPASVAWRGR